VSIFSVKCQAKQVIAEGHILLHLVSKWCRWLHSARMPSLAQFAHVYNLWQPREDANTVQVFCGHCSWRTACSKFYAIY